MSFGRRGDDGDVYFGIGGKHFRIIVVCEMRVVDRSRVFLRWGTLNNAVQPEVRAQFDERYVKYFSGESGTYQHESRLERRPPGGRGCPLTYP